MSAKFKAGDRVRVINTEEQNPLRLVRLELAAEHTVLEGGERTIRVDNGGGLYWDASRFEKVEFVVGQKVSGGDYPRLPIGSVVFEEPADEDVVDKDTVPSVPVMKTGDDEWTNQGWPGVFTNAEMADDVRTLTQLGDGVADIGIVEAERDFFCCAAPSHIHGTVVLPSGERVPGMLTAEAEPEDAADAYVEPRTRVCRVCGCTDEDCRGCIERTGHPCWWVEGDLCSACADTEPEPLKEGDWVQVWAQVRDPEPDYDGEIKLRLDRLGAKTEDRWADAWARPDAIVRPADGATPPWVKPIEEPTGLGAVVTATLPHGAVGVTMVRYATWDHHKKPWQAQGGSTGFSWDQMTDVTVVSEGWTGGAS